MCVAICGDSKTGFAWLAIPASPQEQRRIASGVGVVNFYRSELSSSLTKISLAKALRGKRRMPDLQENRAFRLRSASSMARYDLVAFGFLVSEMRLGRKAFKVWFVLLQIGTWANGAAGMVAAFVGTSSKLMPAINEKFPPPNGTDNPIVSGSLQLCGITIMAALLMTLYGLFRAKASLPPQTG
jgi:hypothetical protein